MRNTRAFWLATWFLLGQSVLLGAHPHLWVGAKAEIETSGDRLLGIVAEKPVKVKKVERFQAVVIVKPNPKRAYYMGQIVPVEATVTW